MDARKDIMWRVYLIYGIMVLFALAIIGQIIRLQFIEGDYWVAKADSLQTDYKKIDAVRGNIFAADGSLLATSVPIFDIRMDTHANGLSNEVFNKQVDSLALALSMLFKDKSKTEYRRELREARRDKNKYLLIQKNANFVEVKKLRNFPIFRMGRYKGGLILVPKNKREVPFRLLARRTIGYDRDGIQPVGIEGAYNQFLEGTSGKRLMQKISGGVWKPINDENEIEPKDGDDIITTIDINIQDVAQNALMTQLVKHNANKGCVVLMEVKTGEIKAIANLAKNNAGNYDEIYNHAIGESTEPGSTFKLASLMIALEDKLIDITDSVDTENGTFRFADQIMRDSKEGGYGKITVQQAFEYSSNVAISKLLTQSYAKNPGRFSERLKEVGLDKPLGLQIAGETNPTIKSASDKSWSRVTLPWMSIGYEVQMTPLQVLALYNAVANDGVMVKPMLVKEVQTRGKVIKKFDTTVLNPSICSMETIKKLKIMMEGVVERGTAQNLKNAEFKIAGKTGTAQIASGKLGYKVKSYQASFAGYFPAENPLYSCIVVVYAPSNSVYYGNLVAGPIFKEIADKVYSTRIDMHKEIEPVQFIANEDLPNTKSGYKKPLDIIYKTLGYHSLVNATTEWVSASRRDTVIEINDRTLIRGLVPNVIGMGLRDAIYILESAGLQVNPNGRGMVTRQSLSPGQRIIKGDKILIELS